MTNAIRLLLVVCAVFAPSETSARADEFSEALEARRIQTELPAPRANEGSRFGGSTDFEGDGGDGGSDRSTTNSRRSSHESSPASRSVPSMAFDASPLLKALAIVFLVVLLLIAIFAVVRYRADRVPRAERVVVAARGRTEVVADEVAADLEIAERLAAEGRFDAAIRTLLLDAQATIARVRGRALRPSATSRELVASLPLEPGSRAALGRIVGRVEATHFGSRIATRGDYERSREDHAVAIEKPTA